MQGNLFCRTHVPSFSTQELISMHYIFLCHINTYVIHRKSFPFERIQCRTLLFLWVSKGRIEKIEAWFSFFTEIPSFTHRHLQSSFLPPSRLFFIHWVGVRRERRAREEEEGGGGGSGRRQGGGGRVLFSIFHRFSPVIIPQPFYVSFHGSAWVHLGELSLMRGEKCNQHQTQDASPKDFNFQISTYSTETSMSF